MVLTKLRWPILILAIILFIWYAVPIGGYFSGFLAYFSVGQVGTSYFTVGQETPDIELTVGNLPINAIADFPLVVTIATIAPAILLIAVVIFMFFMIYSQWSQRNMLNVGLLSVVVLILIGLTVLIGVPLMLQGFDTIMWGAW